MKTMLALAALAGALCVAPASAQTSADETQIVSYADLDLHSERGRSMLDRRIRSAVQAACGTPSSVDLEGKNEARRCRAATLERIAVQRDRAVAAALQASPATLASTR